MAKQATTRTRVSLDELKMFVGVFQDARSMAEVAKAMGWKWEKVRAQATKLRKRGVNLKKFPKKSVLSNTDVDSLKALIIE